MTGHRVVAVRAVVRDEPAAEPGQRWDTVVVGWLPDPGRLFCNAHPHARRCEHIDHVIAAITEGANP